MSLPYLGHATQSVQTPRAERAARRDRRQQQDVREILIGVSAQPIPAGLDVDRNGQHPVHLYTIRHHRALLVQATPKNASGVASYKMIELQRDSSGRWYVNITRLAFDSSRSVDTYHQVAQFNPLVLPVHLPEQRMRVYRATPIVGDAFDELLAGWTSGRGFPPDWTRFPNDEHLTAHRLWAEYEQHDGCQEWLDNYWERFRNTYGRWLIATNHPPGIDRRLATEEQIRERYHAHLGALSRVYRRLTSADRQGLVLAGAQASSSHQ